MDFKICGKVYSASVLNSLEFMVNSKRVWRMNSAETLLSSFQGYRNILAKTFSAQTDQVRNRLVETKLLMAHTLSCVAPTFLKPVCIYVLVSFSLKFQEYNLKLVHFKRHFRIIHTKSLVVLLFMIVSS